MTPSSPHQPPRKNAGMVGAILLLTLAALLLPSSALVRGGLTATAQEAYLAQVEGQVLNKANGRPVIAARVIAPDLGLTALTDFAGRFTWRGIALNQLSVTVSIYVSAIGFGDWSLVNVRVVSDDTLILKAELDDTPTEIVVPPPRFEIPEWQQVDLDAAQTLRATIEGGAGDPQLPQTIRVRVTGYAYCDLSLPYTVETVDFKEYVKHVLPNEWVPTWPRESLRAGAMAAKMYAWSYVAAGGKWDDADVYDSTCDQVYNPAVSYGSTDRAVDFTWNWKLTRDDQLLRTFYRAYLSQCPEAILGSCMGQVESRDMAYDRYTWDEILDTFYVNSSLSAIITPPGGYALRFYGNGYGDIDRVKIPVDPQVPADVGAEDFTLEWWMKALPGQNSSSACTPGGENWIYGNILFDRDIYGDGDHGDYGISLAGGRIAFGVNNGSTSHTLCGASDLADGRWHHLAVTRSVSDGMMRVFVDGRLEAEADGPDGDISYRDGRDPTAPNDPYLVIGAEKHDAGAEFPSFSGWIDEVRLSNLVRYSAAFTPPINPFSPDAGTVALYHFDEGVGNTIGDSSGDPGGPSDGLRKYGGGTNGPEWTDDTPWYVPPTPTPTSTTTQGATETPSETWTATPTPAETTTPTATATATQTATASPTATPSATPTPTETSSPTPTATPTSSFDDVPLDHWAYPYIEILYAEGYIAGCGVDPLRFCPDNTMTRAESAVFVLRGVFGADFKPEQPGSQLFEDLPLASWATKWATTLLTAGYTEGCSVDPLKYCPWQGHSRAEGTVFYLRMLNGTDWLPPEPSGIFADVSSDYWASDWIEAAYEAGLIPACDEGPLRFCPEEPLTRGMAAYMMVQAKDLLPP